MPESECPAAAASTMRQRNATCWVVRQVLGRFAHPDAEAVGIVARERGTFALDEQERTNTFEHFRWYRLGLYIDE